MLFDREYIVGHSVQDEQIAGVYFLIDGGEVVYVGQSIDVMRRIGTHRNAGKKFDRYFYIECTIEDMDNLEADYIVHFSPRYNNGVSRNSKWFTVARLKSKLNTDAYKIKAYAKHYGINDVNGHYMLADFANFKHFKKSFR